jgi:hypothetical protein
MAILFNPVVQKIESFCRHGFLSGEALQKLMTEQRIETSYDIRLGSVVPLNCISALRGIPISILHPAKGGSDDGGKSWR